MRSRWLTGLAIAWLSGWAAAAVPNNATSARIESMLDLLAAAVDRSDYDVLERLFADQVTVDYTSLWGGQPETLQRAALLTSWAEFLPGFDAVRHEFSDYRINVNEDAASAVAAGQAKHWIDDQTWTVSGRYRWRLARSSKEWRVTEMTFVVDHERGSRQLLESAHLRAERARPDWLIARTSRATARRFLELLSAKDIEAFLALWDADAVQLMPLSPPQFPRRIEGIDALQRHWSGLPDNVGRMDFHDLTVWSDRGDPHRVFMRFRGEIEILPTDRLYAGHYFAVLELTDAGRIRLFQEFYDPLKFLEAWGRALDEGFSLDPN